MYNPYSILVQNEGLVSDKYRVEDTILTSDGKKGLGLCYVYILWRTGPLMLWGIYPVVVGVLLGQL